MNVVVTGACGHVGVATCRQLIADGHNVVGLDRVSCDPPPTPKLRILDLLDANATTQALARAEVVIHLANHVTHVGQPPQRVFTENCAMNINVCEGARSNGAKLIVFASSVHAFTGGRAPTQASIPSEIRHLPLDGNMPWHCDEVYGLSKICGEKLLQLYADQHGITSVALRFPRLLSEPPPPEGWPAKEGALLDEAFTWLTYSDASRLIAAIVRRPSRGYRCYFPASPYPWTHDGSVEELRIKYFPGVPLTISPPLTSFVDLTTLNRETGWTPNDI